MSHGLRRFLAHFGSVCDDCGNDIWEGDQIARTPDGSYICESCFCDYEEED